MPVARLASDSDILDALPEVFAGAVMIPTQRVVSGLRKSGLRLSADPEESLVSALRVAKRPYYWLAGDRFLADGVAMVAGRTFAHALTEAEVDADALEAMPDFAGPMLDLLILFGVRLPDGRLVRPFERAPEAPVPGVWFPIRLPGGVLSGMGLRPGDLVGLAGTSQGCPELVAVGPLDSDQLGPMLVQRLAMESNPLPVDAVVTAALALGQWPDGAQAPISVAAADAGLACDDRRIAPLGVPLPVDHGGLWSAEYLADTYGLAGDQAHAVAAALAVVEAGDRVAEDLAESLTREFDGADLDPSDPVSGLSDDEVSWAVDRLRSGFEQAARQVSAGHQAGSGEVLAALSDPFCALVVAEEALEGFEAHVFGLGMLVHRLDQRGLPRQARAAVEYLRGRQLELLEGPAPAEAAFRAALDRVSDHTGALLSLAGIAVDRSQYAVARGLIDRSGVQSDHPVATFLTDMVESGHPLDRAGKVVPLAGRARNQPCPCGSGRKYKVCHGHAASGSRTVSVSEQAHLLYDKAVLFATMRHAGHLGYLLEDVLEQDDEIAVALLPAVHDALLFNDGALEEYLNLRGDLLSEVERNLIEAWLARAPSVYEVEACEPGQWLDLRDLRTGERHRAAERKGSLQVRERHLLYTRVAEVGDRKELYGGITVIRVEELDTLMDLLDGQCDAEELIGFLLDRLAPALVTPEGDPIELCTATFTTTAPVKLARELDGMLTRETPHTWTVRAVTPDGDDEGDDDAGALASLELHGRTLTLHTISRARAASVIDRLDAVQAKLSQTGFQVTEFEDYPGED